MELSELLSLVLNNSYLQAFELWNKRTQNKGNNKIPCPYFNCFDLILGSQFLPGDNKAQADRLI